MVEYDRLFCFVLMRRKKFLERKIVRYPGRNCGIGILSILFDNVSATFTLLFPCH